MEHTIDIQLNLQVTIYVIVGLILLYLLIAVHHLKQGLKSTINTLVSIDKHLGKLIEVYGIDPEEK